MEDALNKLAQYFPSMDRNFLEDVYVSSKKDFDKTVDELLGMGVEMTVDKKDQQKPVPVQQPQKPTYTPSPAVTSPPPPTNPHYYHHTPSNLPPPLTPTPSSPQVPHHLQQQQQQQPPINMNPPSSIPTTTSLINSGYQPRMDPYSIPATPPPIMNSLNPSSLNPPSTAPTAPLALMKSDSQSDQKRYETLKQDLSLEYQRISEQHKYNLELQQKLDQLSEFTSSEQKKLEEQRLAFNEEKRRFSEELTNRFKALQEDYGRQKAELVAQEERRVAEAEALAEAKRQAKEERRVIKTQQKEEEISLRQATESALKQEINDLLERLAEASANGKELQQCNDELAEFKYEAEQQINSLQETNKNLTKQLRNTEYEASAEVLSYFSSVVSTLADGIHSVSLERANKRSDNESEGENEGERENPLQDLKRTFFKTIHESFNNKLRESDH